MKMNSFLRIFNILFFLILSALNFSALNVLAQGQVVPPEYPQEKDWQSHYLFNQRLEQIRREGLVEVRKKRTDIEKQQKGALDDYKRNRSKATTESQVGSKEWMTHVKKSLHDIDEKAKQDAQYIQSKKAKINSAAEKKYGELVAREFDIKISDRRRGGLVKQSLPGSSGGGGGGSGYSSGGAHSFDGGGSSGGRGDFAPNNSPNGVPSQRRNPAPMDEMDDDMPDLAMPPPNMEDEPLPEQPPPFGF